MDILSLNKSKPKLIAGGVVKPSQITTGVIQVETIASGAKLPVSTGGGIVSGDSPITPTVKYTFTIIPTPANAIVMINGVQQSSITAEAGTAVTWSVEAEGYTTQSGNLTLTEDKTLDVALKEILPSYVIGKYMKFEQTADAKAVCPLDYLWNTQDTQEIKIEYIRSAGSFCILSRDDRNGSAANANLDLIVTSAANQYPRELRYDIAAYNGDWIYYVSIYCGANTFPMSTTKTIRFSGSSIYFDDVQNTNRTSTFAQSVTALPVCLFGIVAEDGVFGIGNDDAGCFYYLKVTNSSGELIHNYVPALREADNTYVIRDLVTETDFEFKGNTGAITEFVPLGFV